MHRLSLLIPGRRKADKVKARTAEESAPSAAPVETPDAAPETRTTRWKCANCGGGCLAQSPSSVLTTSRDDYTEEETEEQRERSNTHSSESTITWTSFDSCSVSEASSTNSLTRLDVTGPGPAGWGNEADSPVWSNTSSSHSSYSSSPGGTPESARSLNACICGEPGCTCRCRDAAVSGPSPRDLNFFPLSVDFREIAGVSDDQRQDPLFCSPECRWSHRARQEFKLGKQVASRQVIAQHFSAQQASVQQASVQQASVQQASVQQASVQEVGGSNKMHPPPRNRDIASAAAAMRLQVHNLSR